MAIEFGPKDRYRTYGVPSLDLTFADKKSLVDRISGNNLITFTRSTTGTYVGSDGLIKTAAVNEPRFDHNPLTRESLGLLIEEARTNTVTYSQDFSNAAWGKTNTTITSNAVVGLDGATTAAKLVESATTGIHTIQTGVVWDTYKSCTLFAKQAERFWIAIGMYDTARGWVDTYFNLSTGTIGNNGNTSAIGGYVSIQSFPNGWYKLTIGRQANAGSTFRILVSQTNGTITYNGDSNSYAGDGSSGVYIWGAQVETGSFSTSYIPTTASTVTRAADVASITGTNFSSWYRQNEGTIVTNLRNTIDKNFQFPWTISAGGSASSNISPRMQASAPRLRILFNFNGISSTTGAIDSTFTTGKFAVGFLGLNTTSTSLYYSENGASVSSNTFTNVVSTNDTIAFGYYFNNSGAGYYTGTISRLTYYQTRLPDTTLQALTKL